MSSFCPDLDKNNSKQNEFYLECAHRTFETFHQNFDRVKVEYLDYIKKINDPILRHISLYFVQYYIDGYLYYKSSEKHHRSAACQYLNRWLQGQKDLFTYGEQCETRKDLWEKKIESLWGMIKNEYTITEYNNKKEPWCSKYPYDLKTRYPDKLTPLKCEESISKESIIAHSLPQPDKTDCDCSQNVIPVTLALPDEPLEKDRTKNIAVTSGFTAAGTLGTLFFLYRFTPMMSWFRRPGMNNVGTDLYMNPGGAESFISMQQGNGSNNLFYQP